MTWKIHGYGYISTLWCRVSPIARTGVAVLIFRRAVHRVDLALNFGAETWLAAGKGTTPTSEGPIACRRRLVGRVG